jgi:hypothetical protein
MCFCHHSNSIVSSRQFGIPTGYERKKSVRRLTRTYNYQPSIVILKMISRMRNRTLPNREKNCRQGRFEAEADNLEIVKGFRSQGAHNILCATRKCVIIK